MQAAVEQKFIKACEENSDALFRFCSFKVSDREVAKDLVAETFMRVWNYLTKGQQIDNLRAFFYRTLSNLIIDEYRKKKTVSLDKLAESGFDPSFDERESLEDKIDGKKALESLKEIPEMYREVIFMRYVEEMSLSEIAKIRGDTENTVAVQIHRGLKKVKKLFNRE